MQTIYNLKTSELNNSFIASIKMLYENKNIEITISEILDETEYLLKSPSNKEKLLQSIKNVNSGKKMTEMNLNQINGLIHE